MSHRQAFVIDSARVSPTPALAVFAAKVDSANSAAGVNHIDIVGSASLDGSVARNRRLAAQRAEALKRYFLSHTSLPDSVFALSSVGEDWDGFRRMLPQYLSAADIAAVDSIISSTDLPDRRERLLRRFDRGRLWRTLTADILPAQRSASMTVKLRPGSLMHFPADSAARAIAVGPDPAPEKGAVADTAAVEPIVPAPPVSAGTPPAEPLNWYLKTNVPAWAMLWTNIAVEFDCAPHWSVQLPVYFSCFNYFTGHRKFRTFAVVPEARYWFLPGNQGWFAGAHLGMAYFNVAFGGATRYQDLNERTPALGGGLNFGYRMRLGRGDRWKLEFSLGAGVYRLKYHTFHNYHNGLVTGRHQRTFFGVDNAAVSVCYTFDLTKGGRR